MKMSNGTQRGSAPTPRNDDDSTTSTYTKSTPKTYDDDEDKVQSITIKKNNTHDDDGTAQHSPHVVDHGCLLALDDAITDINAPPHACTSSQPPNNRSTLHETPFRTTPRNCSNSAMKGLSGEKQVDMSVWC